MAQIHLKKQEQDDKAENDKKRLVDFENQKEMSEIRQKFTQFKHCKVSDEAMRAFSQYMKEKMESKKEKKAQMRDLGLAAIDSYVMIDQMQRNDSTNYKLRGTSENRASLCDLNAVRPLNYLHSYLSRVTGDARVPMGNVKTRQYDTEHLQTSLDGSAM